MKTALSLLAVAATILVAPSLSATQSTVTPESAAILPDIAESAGEVSAAVQSYIGRGDEQSNRLHFDAAAREYARAVDIARHEGHLPSWTSWKLASAQYYDGNLLGAAASLDQLANEAARVGDLQVEALALYYSAWLDGKAGSKVEALARVSRLEGLLRSQYMPVAIRERLSGLLRSYKEVALK